VACMREQGNVYTVLMGKPEGCILHARPGCRWEASIKMSQAVGWGCVNRIHMAQGRDQWWVVLSMIMNCFF
jgi:hypothetical protein